jgi:hypothetical protein
MDSCNAGHRAIGSSCLTCRGVACCARTESPSSGTKSVSSGSRDEISLRQKSERKSLSSVNQILPSVPQDDATLGRHSDPYDAYRFRAAWISLTVTLSTNSQVRRFRPCSRPRNSPSPSRPLMTRLMQCDISERRIRAAG